MGFSSIIHTTAIASATAAAAASSSSSSSTQPTSSSGDSATNTRQGRSRRTHRDSSHGSPARGTTKTSPLRSRSLGSIMMNISPPPGELPADQEIDAIVARITAKHAVSGFIVIDLDNGGIVKSSMISADGGIILGKKRGTRRQSAGSSSLTSSLPYATAPDRSQASPVAEESASDLVSSYATTCVNFVKAANEVADQFFEEDDGLKLLRLRTKEHELMIVPDTRFILAVINDIHSKP
ncbi:uncharacterized protein V1518DRAFT_410591 [Limtongia smithiae]|uniref:uncharacterized protein n=1 Tax=Limtongia smithiae TaxID=1125753 RepID=UPI0034CFDED3